MRNPSDLDQKAIAARFERLGKKNAPVHSASYKRNLSRADFFLRDIERRMLDRLAFTKLVPNAVLDVGCGHGAGVRALEQRFSSALVVGLDLAMSMLEPPLPSLNERAGMMAGLCE